MNRGRCLHTRAAGHDTTGRVDRFRLDAALHSCIDPDQNRRPHSVLGRCITYVCRVSRAGRGRHRWHWLAPCQWHYLNVQAKCTQRSLSLGHEGQRAAPVQSCTLHLRRPQRPHALTHSFIPALAAAKHLSKNLLVVSCDIRAHCGHSTRGPLGAMTGPWGWPLPAATWLVSCRTGAERAFPLQPWPCLPPKRISLHLLTGVRLT